MEEEGRDHAERLREFILSRIETEGAIPFSRFMEWCLYHPAFGYYQTERRKIGRDGDYYTSSCVHPLFGYLISKQLRQMSEFLGGNVFNVVEMGSGRGLLCKDILHWAKEKALSFYRSLRYTLIENGPFSLSEQKEFLAEEEAAGKVVWIDGGRFGEREDGLEGCVLSNELIDAFPVHRVMLDQGRLRELYVTRRNGRFEETWDEPSDPRLFSYFESMGVSLQEGQKAEVNLRALDWMEKVGRWLKRGFVLTIDYGALARELYASYRREGTFLCYYKHQVSENPYERVGEQDLTSHVNFTALVRKGEEAGLTFTGFVPQYRFLIGLGFIEEMEGLAAGLSEIDGLKLRLSLKHLIDPEVGMGEAFKVLIQHKGVQNPRLDGLREFHSMAASPS